MNLTYIFFIRELIEPLSADRVPLSVRKVMRIRAFVTLCLFGLAAVVALKYPIIGLAVCCCCLAVYLGPEAPGSRS
ncbi:MULTISPECIES: hypothetical protein [unclassified Mesorhizobium]|uniref:hypothetical protein n=1 Tax=unclassified Mesorhizobium TaxID=325217 RepID=UPI0016747B8C|nr:MULTISPECIES: hypothetical protein [unclassified Mesorhizobium]